MAVVSPTVRDQRLVAIGTRQGRYLYAGIRTGITGSMTKVDAQTLSFLNRIGGSGKMILAGFGVAAREQVKMIAPHVHAVVVGTALIRCIDEGDRKDLYPRLKAKVEELAGR